MQEAIVRVLEAIAQAFLSYPNPVAETLS